MNGLVLIADGDHQRAKRLAAVCTALGLETRTAIHGAAALEIALAEQPEVLVAQLGLPLIDGVQLGGILHANPRTNSVELVFLADTAAEAGQTELDGEVVAPPADLDALARRVQTLIEKQNANEEQPDPDGEESGGVEGQLSQLPLADLLQLFHVSQKTGVVEVRRYTGRPPVEAGRVLLRAGNIVHAEVGTVAGAKALYRLLAWDRGEFKIQLNQPNNSRHIGFCDGTAADIAELQEMAESEGAEEMRIEKKPLKSGREIWTLSGGG